LKRPYEVKIKDILNLKTFKDAQIAAGDNIAIENIVKKINVIEVPDIQDWCVEDELILTQGFSLNDEKGRQRLLINIIEKGASGLVIKSKRYLDKIPEDMMKIANDRGFPLIEIPFDLKFSEVITDVMSLINGRQTMLLEYNIKIHKELMDVVLKGGSITDICEQIAFYINNTVIIEDKYEKLLSYSVMCKSEEEEKALEEKIKTEFSQDKSNESLHMNKILNSKYREIKIPISNGLEIFGYIVVLETIRTFSSLDISTLENATKVTAFAIINERTIKETEKKHINEFINSLVSGNMEEEDIIFRGKHYNMDLTGKYNLLIIKYNNSSSLRKHNFAKEVEKMEKISDEIYNLSKFTLSIEGLKGIVGTKADEIILIIENNSSADKNMLKDNLSKLSPKILSQVKEVFENYNIITAISNTHSGINIPKAYIEAKTVINICKDNTSMKEQIVHFDDLGVFKLLNYTPKKEQISFLDEYLLKLINYDAKSSKELIPTLEAYFILNGNIKDMCKYLHIHYNTVLYRLQKIKEIIGDDLESWDSRLNLQIALKLLILNKGQYEKLIHNQNN